jgi:transcriptional regulator with XRE-family HTH domain
MAATPAGGQQLPLGAALARHRRRRGLTGTQLGDAVGMSQAKISRVETGTGSADPVDVESIARALDLDDTETHRLVQQAVDEAQERMTDWRQAVPGLAGRQRRTAQIETTSTTIRAFQTSVVPGLLQTSEYARATLNTFTDPIFPGRYSSSAGVPEAVSMRMRRQEILPDPAKRFRFVLAEAALANRVCPPVAMPAQLQRIREVAGQANVSVGIIEFDAPWRFLPVHGFKVFDEHTVEIDLMNTGLATQGRSEVRLYRQVFDALEEQATTVIDPILDRYLDLYLDLSRPIRRSGGSAPPEQSGGGEPDPGS